MSERLVSFCVLAYNQEKYIADCVRSVLNQTHASLEIIISDDCSTDETWTVIKHIVQGYKGKHLVKIFRNDKNLGLAAHFSLLSCHRASGDYMIFLGGDDISSRTHAQIAIAYASKFPKISVFDFSGDVINGHGETIRTISPNKSIQTFTISDYLKMRTIDSFAPGRLIKRELFKVFGPIDSSSPTEDSVIVLRALLINGLMRIDENLVQYRRHGNNISSAANLARMNNGLIISQYQRDIIECYKKGLIGAKYYETLMIRSFFDFKLRKLFVIENTRVKKIKRKVFKFTYIIMLLMIGRKNFESAIIK